MLLKQNVLVTKQLCKNQVRVLANKYEDEIVTKVNDNSIVLGDIIDEVKIDKAGGADCVRDNELNKVP